jgi:hypothetical protein
MGKRRIRKETADQKKKKKTKVILNKKGMSVRDAVPPECTTTQTTTLNFLFFCLFSFFFLRE